MHLINFPIKCKLKHLVACLRITAHISITSTVYLQRNRWPQKTNMIISQSKVVLESMFTNYLILFTHTLLNVVIFRLESYKNGNIHHRFYLELKYSPNNINIAQLGKIAQLYHPPIPHNPTCWWENQFSLQYLISSIWILTLAWTTPNYDL